MKFKIFILILTVAMFLVGGVSGQEVNFALSGTPNLVHTPPGNSCGGCPYGMGWKDNALHLNDNSITNPVGVCTSILHGAYSGSYTSTIDILNTVNQINRIEYVSWGAAYRQSGTIVTSLLIGGNWYDIDSRSVNTGGSGSNPQTMIISAGGPWSNVEKVRVHATLQAATNYCVNSYIYEIRAFGTACIPETNAEFCSRLGTECGNLVSGADNCGNLRTNVNCGICTIDNTCYEPACIIGTCGENPVAAGENDESCVLPNVCDGNGNCVLNPELTGAYWADMTNDLTEISQADLNDRVQLRVSGIGMENEEIEYTIWKQGELSWNPLNWFDSEIAQTSTTGFTTWKAEDSGEYYFISEILSIEGTMQSGNLEVLETENNQPPLVEILKPNIGEIYYVGELIDFEGQISDVDDEFTFLWDFGDDTTGSELITTHSYAISGQKTITLTATDERGLVRSDMVSVLIISGDGEYAFAHIDEPKWGVNVFGSVIDFNASSSYAIEAAGCSPGPCTLTCSAGGCPDNTLKDNSGQPIGTGACLLSPNGECRNFYNEIEFNWTFDDGTFNEAIGDAGKTFIWNFKIPGAHTSLLTISKNPESSTAVEFTNFFGSFDETNTKDNLDYFKIIVLVLIIFCITIICIFLLIKKKVKKRKRRKSKTFKYLNFLYNL